MPPGHGFTWGRRKACRAKRCVSALLLLIICNSVVALEIHCDRSSLVTDVCVLHGDVRVDVRSGQIMLYARNPDTKPGLTRIRPHPRKWNVALMQEEVTELTIETVAYDDSDAPVLQCNRQNPEPGVVFSVGGYSGNPFHDFQEIFLPLFVTTRSYAPKVTFLLTDLKGEWWWRNNDPNHSIIGAMTKNAIRLLGLEQDTFSRPQGVDCFDSLTVGLFSDLVMYNEHGGWNIRAASPVSIQEFAPFVRQGLNVPLPDKARVHLPAGATPVIGIVQRNTTRKFVNYKELLAAAEGEGFMVVPIMFEGMTHTNLVETLASLDILVGVHGAGLSHFCLMRPGGAVMQVMPYGEGNSRDVTGVEYKNFAQEMELEYYEWRVPVTDSTILQQHNHTDPVVTSPKKVWTERADAMRLYHRQDVRMPVDLFVAFLHQMERTLNAKAAMACEADR